MSDDNPTIEHPGEDENRRPGDPAGGSPRPRRLTRSSGDHVIAGVAGGLGRYFGVDPVMFRIGFAVSVLFGGLGILAYLLLAVFVPTDGAPDRAQRLGGRLQKMGFWRGLGMIAVGALALAGLFALAGGAAFAVGLGWGVPVSIGILVVGAVLALTAFRGGARWLIAPVLAVLIGAGTASAADLDLRGGIGERHFRPLSATAIPADGYRLGVGRLVIDLRNLDWKAQPVVDLDVDLGTGQADIFVPERVCVQGSSHVGIGETEVVGEQNDGFDVTDSAGAGSGTEPRLEIHARVDIGQVRVTNSDSAKVDDDGDYSGRSFSEDLAPLRAAQARACAKR